MYCVWPDPTARPSLSLPERAAVTEGEEKTIQCDITGFYPEKLDVTWYFQNGSRTIHAGISHFSRVCTEMAVHNADGTYSIRSGITLHSSAVRDGEMRIICQVDHRTYTRPHNRSVILTVQGGVKFNPSLILQTLNSGHYPLIHWLIYSIYCTHICYTHLTKSLFLAAPSQPLYNAVTLIAVTSAISLLMVTSVIGGTLLLYMYFCKGMSKWTTNKVYLLLTLTPLKIAPDQCGKDGICLILY